MFLLILRLTHGPAHQIFDRIVRGDEVGCEALRTRISELRPRLHLAGHIHEAHGAYVHTWDPSSNFEPPEVQNDHAFLENSQDLPSGVPDDAERTLFINAANWPMEVNARRNGVQSAFGGPGFQAVVVDMKEWSPTIHSQAPFLFLVEYWRELLSSLLFSSEESTENLLHRNNRMRRKSFVGLILMHQLSQCAVCWRVTTSVPSCPSFEVSVTWVCKLYTLATELKPTDPKKAMLVHLLPKSLDRHGTNIML
ncbi:hypothetical protein D9613_010780 [Agrocybe pediades]|uniref:Uncharacterized protein n=1 Tax=Agrocybe pediades TaxID=84607 RepID=A0A8H4QLB9_9AGAR|nr:hypothetical protein D9613_010780 [Agrocybe pediades]